MKMKIKLGQVYFLLNMLKTLSNTKLPIKFSYKITKLINELQVPYDFLTKESEKILNEYGEYENDGVTPKFEERDGGKFHRVIKEDKRENFYKEMLELEDTEQELSGDVNFSLDELEPIGEIEPRLMQALFPFIEE